MAGDHETGVTIMQMEKGLDTGPVYASESVVIDDYDDVEHLKTNLQKPGLTYHQCSRSCPSSPRHSPRTESPTRIN